MQMIPETGEILPKDAVCFWDIPVNKTSTAYTKPVHSLVGKRINEWEAVRPQEQPRALDKKTNEAVHFLFSYRSRRISKTYITDHLIPLLCRKAGIPIEDSRGKITSHRARATIASMLYNAQRAPRHLSTQRISGAQTSIIDTAVSANQPDQTRERSCQSRVPGAKPGHNRSAPRPGSSAFRCCLARGELEIL